MRRTKIGQVLSTALATAIALAPLNQPLAQSYQYRIPLAGVDALPPPGETGEPFEVGDYASPYGFDRNAPATVPGPGIAGGATPYSATLATGTLPRNMAIGAGGQISGTPDVPGTYPLSIRFRDGAGREQLRTVTIAVLDPAGSPLSAGFASGAYALTTNQAATIPGPSVGGGQAPYSFSGGSAEAAVDPSTGAVTATYASAGDRTVNVTVRDAQGRTAPASVTLSVAAPVTASLSPMTAYATIGQAGVIGTLSVSGGRAPYLAQKGAQGLGNILSVSGLEVGYAAPPQAGTYQQPVDVTDADGRPATTGYVTVVAASAPTPGFANAYSHGDAGAAGTIPAPNPGGGEGPYTLALTANPGGVLSGSPASGFSHGALAAGTYGPFEVTATDVRGRTGSQGFTLVIPQPLQVAGYAASYAGVGAVTGTIPAPAVSGGTAPYGYALASPLAGASIDAATGVITYTKEPGTYPLAVRVTDRHNRTATSAPFNLAVSTPYALSYAQTDQLYVGVGGRISANRTGGTGPFTFALKAGGTVPAGMALNAGTGHVEGIPSATSSGSFQIEVTDAGAGNAKVTSAAYNWSVGAIDDAAIWTNVSSIAHEGTYAHMNATSAESKTGLSDSNYNAYSIGGRGLGNIIKSNATVGGVRFNFGSPQPLKAMILRMNAGAVAQGAPTSLTVKVLNGAAVATTFQVQANATQSYSVPLNGTFSSLTLTHDGANSEGLIASLSEVDWIAP